jgi:hypothetical protein
VWPLTGVISPMTVPVHLATRVPRAGAAGGLCGRPGRMRWRRPPVRNTGYEVKPGITGLWQVSGRSRLSVRTALELDLEYVGRRSFFFDVSILARTLPAVFRGGAG